MELNGKRCKTLDLLKGSKSVFQGFHSVAEFLQFGNIQRIQIIRREVRERHLPSIPRTRLCFSSRAQSRLYRTAHIKDSFWVRILRRKAWTPGSSYTNPDGTVRFHGNFRRTNTLGWVPILEPINKMPVEEHIQEKMVFLVPGAVCIGTPVESSNYDIVVCMSNENIATFYPSACPGKGIWWDQIGDNRFVLDKTQIIHCQTL